MSPEKDVRKSHKIIGQTIKMRLEEHPYKKTFAATISGIATTRDGSEKLYLLKLEGEASKQLSHNYVLFRPEYLKFEKHFLKKALRSGGIDYKPSLEEFVFKRDPAHTALFGRIYGFPLREITEPLVLDYSELFVLAHCRIHLAGELAAALPEQQEEQTRP